MQAKQTPLPSMFVESSQATQVWAESAGVETLRRMASVDRYNQWVFQKLAHHLGLRVLEVGCGIGNMTPFWLRANQVTCIDVLPESVAAVRRQFAATPHVEALVADITSPTAVDHLGPSHYDTVVCINVLEHIEYDGVALRHMHDVLMPGGKLLLFVPAGQYLYGHLDQVLGHYRRYALASLRALVQAQGFEVLEASYMNAAGIPGWFLSSRILRREAPPRGLLWLFNLLTPVFVRVEEQIRPSFGQSVLCIARRPE
jgi:2-polyprenyl-3-methyl-5-hydroxy-6-metoxy-1,4-benzoquinol methylase